ncbi:MAG: UDP-N-acetylglucosamine--N-acetylmuramyl-(pentapeptide) pyrophosphoryl-undecaprenol N-acetylglucosamine transferase [Verrucomicrobiales bacterium]|jgi:UDP-N-acetylglucosamine--N-acetylmuramyl-(pentapeptide) pyrophosphoryl-undecaprenol N-acetylglucosamine transferase|nr:UDP-N-acetylglucosamine--N-acetylmuramyl-(pentapeptide) pyrophosphoryl-undecaprenol N-acetylglucosamine transferase [Verrucomicrobiales bacterium]
MANIGIACGGTGGHLYPGLAVAEALAAMGHATRLYVSSKEIDRVILAGYPQFASVTLPVIGWPGLGLRTLAFGKKFWDACRLAGRELREQQLDAVLGMGGFTSAPLILSGARRGVPVLLHESNAVPGRVTRLLAKNARAVLLGFAECAKRLPGAATKHTGTPVRATLRRLDRQRMAEWWGLDAGKFTVAIIGGSQGARGLNRMMIQAMAEWRQWRDEVQFIHLTGPAEDDLLAINYRRNGFRAATRPYCGEMEKLYSLADLVVARAGAASLTEIGWFGLPSVLVPYPAAAGDHQTRNARIFITAGAALMVREGKDDWQRLAAAVSELRCDHESRASMAARAATLTVRDAARRVAEEVQNAL